MCCQDCGLPSAVATDWQGLVALAWQALGQPVGARSSAEEGLHEDSVSEPAESIA